MRRTKPTDKRAYLLFDTSKSEQALAAYILSTAGIYQTRFVTQLICEFCRELNLNQDISKKKSWAIIKAYISINSQKTSNKDNNTMALLNAFIEQNTQKNNRTATPISDSAEFPDTLPDTDSAEIPKPQNIDKMPEIDSIPTTLPETGTDDIDIPDMDSFDEDTLTDSDISLGKDALNAWGNLL